ncbi:serine/arginine repetitive matrix protein 1-like [Lolium rigidum]|uniref:serine/arginine repetitive matrix protein 1-like n=1 Tax=Lolium rigidum TaxID=89674 RepID=UPI001F5E2C76|nr:serine/arginine repetitive matrix protein 1-like [Lolium rigidum]
MGCCVSKKLSEPPGAAGEEHRSKVVEARDLPPPEEEKVKEVLSETPRVKPRPKPKRVAGAVVAPSAEKNANAKDGVAKVKGDGGGDRVRRAARPARSLEEKSEAASESSAATTATGPDRSPSKPPRYRQGATSGEPRRARRDRSASAAPGGRASPSPPPPRRDPGRRSPSPAAKRSQDQRRDTAASCAQRKPPVPARPCGRNPTPRRAQEAPTQPTPAPAQSLSQGSTHCASPPTPQAPVQQEDAASCGDGVDGAGDGEGKESLENPLVSMECFIFL